MFEILGRVDANRVVGRFDGPDAQAVLERAELLERFGELETKIGDVHRLMLWLFTTQLAVVGAMIAIAKVT